MPDRTVIEELERLLGEDNLSLLLADVRQALFDEAKADPAASIGFRYEAGRAVGLMGRAMDAVRALPALLECARACERMADVGVHGESALGGKSCRALARQALAALEGVGR